MARQLRIEYEGALYHVMARGNHLPDPAATNGEPTWIDPYRNGRGAVEFAAGSGLVVSNNNQNLIPSSASALTLTLLIDPQEMTTLQAGGEHTVVTVGERKERVHCSVNTYIYSKKISCSVTSSDKIS